MKTHAIHWKSMISGSIGTGTKRFEKEEADRLATELNENYPDIVHEAVIPAPTPTEPAPVEPGLALNGDPSLLLCAGPDPITPSPPRNGDTPTKSKK